MLTFHSLFIAGRTDWQGYHLLLPADWSAAAEGLWANRILLTQFLGPVCWFSHTKTYAHIDGGFKRREWRDLFSDGNTHPRDELILALAFVMGAETAPTHTLFSCFFTSPFATDYYRTHSQSSRYHPSSGFKLPYKALLPWEIESSWSTSTLLFGHEFEQTLGGSRGQRSLACCSPRGHEESDMT